MLSLSSPTEDKGNQLAGPYVFWPLPRLATILGFRYVFVYPFEGDSGLCLQHPAGVYHPDLVSSEIAGGCAGILMTC